MINAICVRNNEVITETNPEKIAELLASGPRLLWVDIAMDIDGFSDEEMDLLSGSFKFHELSIEDCMIPQYHPKIEEFDGYLFAALHGVRPKALNLGDIDEMVFELDMFIGKEYIVTVHAGDIPFMETHFQRARLKPMVELRSMEYLLFNIFEKITQSYEFYTERINDMIDRVEEKLLERPSPEILAEIFSLKKGLISMRKVLDPQKTVYTYFARETNTHFTKRSIAYFREIYFQYDRISQTLLSFAQMTSSLMEIYVSTTTLKLNEIIKFLTIIATIFMPPVIIASYYGMNVDFPEAKYVGTAGLWYVAIATTVGAMFGLFLLVKRKKWL